MFTTKGTKATKKNPMEIGGVRRRGTLSCLSFVPLVSLVVNDLDLQFRCASMRPFETRGIGTHIFFTTKGTKATKKDPGHDGGVRRWKSLPGLSLVPLVPLVVDALPWQFRCISTPQR